LPTTRPSSSIAREKSIVGQDLGPVLHERLAVAGREGGHSVGLRIALVLEQDREVVLAHGPDRDVRGTPGVVRLGCHPLFFSSPPGQ
jgi:hypothetical protein